jgi:hypothetical protein
MEGGIKRSSMATGSNNKTIPVIIMIRLREGSIWICEI